MLTNYIIFINIIYGLQLFYRNNCGSNKMPENIGGHSWVRWMIRQDMPEVLNIENASFEFPWTKHDFVRTLRRHDCIGMVAEYEEQVVGFMIYQLRKNYIRLFNFAVAPLFRRKG